MAGPSASKLADVICEMASDLNRVVTEEEIQAVSSVLKARLRPITYPEPPTVRIKPSTISWEAAEAARNQPRETNDSGNRAPIPTTINIGRVSQPRKPGITLRIK